MKDLLLPWGQFLFVPELNELYFFMKQEGVEA